MEPVENRAETLTVTNAAGGKPLQSVPGEATGAWVSNDAEGGSAIRFWVDGSSPAAAAGHYLAAGDWIIIDTRVKVLKFKAISLTATAAKLQITYLQG